MPDRALAGRVFAPIRRSTTRTREAILAVTGHAALMDGDPVIQRSVQLRNPYVDPAELPPGRDAPPAARAAGRRTGPEAERFREVIVLTINGIAAGLRNTG